MTDVVSSVYRRAERSACVFYAAPASRRTGSLTEQLIDLTVAVLLAQLSLSAAWVRRVETARLNTPHSMRAGGMLYSAWLGYL